MEYDFKKIDELVSELKACETEWSKRDKDSAKERDNLVKELNGKRVALNTFAEQNRQEDYVKTEAEISFLEARLKGLKTEKPDNAKLLERMKAIAESLRAELKTARHEMYDGVYEHAQAIDKIEQEYYDKYRAVEMAIEETKRKCSSEIHSIMTMPYVPFTHRLKTLGGHYGKLFMYLKEKK